MSSEDFVPRPPADAEAPRPTDARAPENIPWAIPLAEPVEAEAVRPAESSGQAGIPAAIPLAEPVDTTALRAGPPPVALDRGFAVPATRPPHPGFWWSVLWCLAFLVVTQVMPVLFVSTWFVIPEILRASQAGPAAEKLDQSELANRVMDQVLTPSIALAQLAVIGFSWFVLRLVVGPDWTRQIAVRWPSPTHVVLVLLGFPGLVLLSNGGYELAKQFLPSLEDIARWFFPEMKDLKLSDMEEMVKVFKSWPWQYGVLIIGLGPGIGEELWCRGFLGRGLVGRYGVVLGVLLTSLFFGLLHVEPRQAAAVALMAVALHLAYLATRSFWVPVLLHTLNNSLAVASSQIPGLAELEQATEKPLPLHYTASAILLAAVAWALYRGRARLHSTLPGVPPWQPEYPGVAYPPRGSHTIVVRPWPGWLAVACVAGAVAFFSWALAQAWEVHAAPVEVRVPEPSGMGVEHTSVLRTQYSVPSRPTPRLTQTQPSGKSALNLLA
jgi:membrane protease YdiL (CAAX protease family)